MTTPIAACGHCGIRHHTHNATDYVCQTCRWMTRITPAADDALPPGQWVRRRAVWYFEADPLPSICGTDRGYESHRRNSEPTCPECRRAHRETNRLRRRVAA